MYLDVIVSVIVKKNVHVSMCLILSCQRDLFECTVVTPLDFSLWVWLKSESDKRRVDTPDELLAGIFDAAARMRKREDQLRRTTCYLHTRVSKCIEVDSGIFEKLFGSVPFFFNFCLTK
jgi:hypothetical protein